MSGRTLARNSTKARVLSTLLIAIALSFTIHCRRAGGNGTGAGGSSTAGTPSEAVADGLAAFAGMVNAGDSNASVSGCASIPAQGTCTYSSNNSSAPVTYSCTGALSGAEALNWANTTNTTYCTFVGNTSVILTRTLNTTRTLPRGVSVTTTSSSTTAYNGTPLGNGTTITQSGSSYLYTMPGVSKTLQNSQGTLDQLGIIATGTFTASNYTGTRVFSPSSATLEVFDNIADYTAIFSIGSPLTFSDSGCCHPTGGQWNVSYNGAITVSGTVQYNVTCGSVTLTLGTTSTTFNLNGCE